MASTVSELSNALSSETTDLLANLVLALFFLVKVLSGSPWAESYSFIQSLQKHYERRIMSWLNSERNGLF